MPSIAKRISDTVNRKFPRISELAGDCQGVTAIEYALLGSLIAVAIVASVTSLGSVVNGLFTAVAAAM